MVCCVQEKRLTRALVRFLRFGTSSSISSASSSWGKSPTSSFYGRYVIGCSYLMFGNPTFMPVSFLLLFLKTSVYLFNKINSQMKRAPATRRRRFKPNSPLNRFSSSLLQPCAARIHCSVKWLLHITAGHNCAKVCIPLPSVTCQRLNSKIYYAVIYGAL